MPVIIEFTFASGKKERIKIPAEIWRKNEFKVTKVFVFDELITKAVLDPNEETSDTDLEDNHLPRKETASKFQTYKEKNSK